MRGSFFLITLLVNMIVPWLSAQGSAFLNPSLAPQANVDVSAVEVFYQFGEKITYKANIRSSDAAIVDVYLFIQPDGQQASTQKVTVGKDGASSFQQTARQLTFNPFTRIYYWYKVILDNRQEFTSTAYYFDYNDNRFTWEKASSKGFTVFWYGRDLSFGQSMLTVAQSGLQNALSYFPVEPPSPIRIYVYANSADLQSALQINNLPWIAGHAAPESGSILVSITGGPEQNLEMERQIPHEIMHLLQYQVIGERYQQYPVWLLEGMASIAELYPNPEYQRLLVKSAQSNSLFAFQTLCTAFPRESTGAYQAYAQSAGFVKYLHQKFGVTGLQNLILQYQNGLGCEEGVSAAFGISLSQLERRWMQESLSVNTSQLVFENFLPYLIIILIICVIPIGIAILIGARKLHPSRS